MFARGKDQIHYTKDRQFLFSYAGTNYFLGILHTNYYIDSNQQIT